MPMLCIFLKVHFMAPSNVWPSNSCDGVGNCSCNFRRRGDGTSDCNRDKRPAGLKSQDAIATDILDVHFRDCLPSPVVNNFEGNFVTDYFSSPLFRHWPFRSNKSCLRSWTMKLLLYFLSHLNVGVSWAGSSPVFNAFCLENAKPKVYNI